MPIELRATQALHLLRDFAVALVTEDTANLSSRQIAILMVIYLEPPPHTVRGLASRLSVTKPVITRALDSMGRLEFVSRRRDEADLRNVIIQRTVKGALYVEMLADLLSQKAQGLSR